MIGFTQDYFKDRVSIGIISHPENISINEKDTLYISYTEEPMPGTMHILPSGILEASGITKYPDAEALFLMDQETSPLNNSTFDLFGAIFFLLSRYEEYDDFVPDIHGRYPFQDSILFKKGQLQIPVIDIWLKWLGDQVGNDLPQRQADILFTMDVDHPFRYFGQPLIRKTGRVIKDIIKRNRAFKRNTAQNDPYNSLEAFSSFCVSMGISSKFFFLVNSDGKLNNSTSISLAAYRNMIKETLTRNQVGLHTGYYSANDINLISHEKDNLERITGTAIVSTRQHFLRFKLPYYYNHLLIIGIEEDYSMGYGGSVGYRAGTSLPFFWYDLQNERITKLKVFPFSWMDATYVYHAEKRTEQEIELDIQRFIQHRTNYGSDIRIVLHNNLFPGDSHKMDWKGIISRNFSADIYKKCENN